MINTAHPSCDCVTSIRPQQNLRNPHLTGSDDVTELMFQVFMKKIQINR